jgi:hypothetical protein
VVCVLARAESSVGQQQRHHHHPDRSGDLLHQQADLVKAWSKNQLPLSFALQTGAGASITRSVSYRVGRIVLDLNGSPLAFGAILRRGTVVLTLDGGANLLKVFRIAKFTFGLLHISSRRGDLRRLSSRTV